MSDASPTPSIAGGTAAADIDAIEEAFVAQWRVYGQAPGGAWHDDGDLVWAEAPVPHLPYNAVIRTRLGDDAAARVDDVVEHFRRRGVHFMWMVHPSARPATLADLLTWRGLSLVEPVRGMALDLRSWAPPPVAPGGSVELRQVSDERDLTAFESLMFSYWELPASSRAYPRQLSRWAHDTGVPGVRWVAWLEDRPVGKAYLSLVGRADTAALFGVYVRPDARGHGIARALSAAAIDRAATLGKRRVVLHSSPMAVGLYRSLGFTDRCPLSVYATTALHGAQPT